jgi:ubiquinone/menaquinone biosynthesis C-methylase UbiE
VRSDDDELPLRKPREASRLITLLRVAVPARQRWARRAEAWHAHVFSSPAFAEVRRGLLEAAKPAAHEVAIDLGAGTGFITLPLAQQVRQVLAVDLETAMLETLRREAASQSLQNVAIVAADLESFSLPPLCADLVVSNYALHHLNDEDKRRLVVRAHTWLRPHGRLVITDMMFGRGASARDREIIRSKARRLLRKGPAGAWRIAKHVVRLGLRVGGEMPASGEFWVQTLQSAGFDHVCYRPLLAEAGLVSGFVRPDHGETKVVRTSDGRPPEPGELDLQRDEQLLPTAAHEQDADSNEK